MNSPAPARIALLGPLVIDQIAAGEVVDRPASVVKELVDNSLDAGATRIDVELEEGGLTRISVHDNGCGIHPDDLLLAVTRHATSKLRSASDLTDIATLGFRGEALASIAAVARVDLRSRQPGAAVGVHLHAIPGEAPTRTPVGMPVGTQVDVHALFANVPARRKFMRAEATEVGHVSDTLLRLAIVHPGVHFTLRHGKRELLNFPRATREARVAQVLERRVAGPFFVFRGEDEGVRVEVHLPHPSAASRGRGSPYIVTRQRVVRERSLAQILAQAYGLSGEAPPACLFVDPPAGAVDVNVHPQKAEVRFSAPQQVYAAVRRVLAQAVAAAPWASELARTSEPVPANLSVTPDAAAAGRPGEPARAVTLPPGAHPGGPPIGFAPTAAPPTEPKPEARRRHDSGALRRVERAAAAAATERRAAADAWLARAEAALDAAHARDLADRPDFDELVPSGEPALPTHTSRPGQSASPAHASRPADAPLAPDASDASPAAAPHRAARFAAPGAATGAPPDAALAATTDATGEPPAWDLDLAPPPVRSDMSLRTSSHPAPGDMSLQTSSPHVSPDMPPSSAPPATPKHAVGDAADWLARAGAEAGPDVDPQDLARDRALAWTERAGAEPPDDLAAPLLRWSERRPDPPQPAPSPPPPPSARPTGTYRLSTRALGDDYDRHKREVMTAAAALRPEGPPLRVPDDPEPDAPLLPELEDAAAPSAPVPRAMRETSGPSGQARPELPTLLTCLPGPVAVFADRDALLAVDLRRVRSHLVFIRLQRDLVGQRSVAVQGLLSPAVVRRPGPDVALLLAARAELLTLGVDLDAFGDDAVVVRGVPAHLRHCVDDADAADLVARIVPWLRIRAGDRAARERGLLDAIATTRGGDPAPRLARRWLGELVDAGATLESVPGIRRWSASALLGGA